MVKNIIKKILETMENQKMTIGGWLLGFGGIVLIRSLLESFSNPSYSGIIASDPQTIVHYALFYLAVLLGFMCIVDIATKQKNKIGKIFLFAFIIIWLPPLLDIISTSGKGISMTYLLENNKQLFFDFLTFFPPRITQGITLGIRTEIFIVLCGIGWYVWHTVKNVKKTVWTVLISFIFVFSMLALPGIMYTVSHLSSSDVSSLETTKFLENSILNSNISHNTIHGSLVTNPIRFFELGFNKLISQICVLLSVILGGIWFWRTEKEKLKNVIKNSRPERIGFYSALLILGISLAHFLGLGEISSWVDILSIIILFISWYGAWMFAVHINDIEDEKIDLISNPERPVTSGKLTSAQMKDISYIWLILSLAGSFAVGYYPFFMNIVFTVSYFIYSAYPLRLKRIPIISSFLISICSLSTILASFFFLSADKNLFVFPPIWTIGIIIIFTLAVNVKDIKDIEGDSKNGIKTLPIIFGKKSKKIIGFLFASSFLLVPIFLHFYSSYILAIPASIIGYKIIIKKNYKEKNVFYLYFAFVVSLILLFEILLYLAKILNISN